MLLDDLFDICLREGRARRGGGGSGQTSARRAGCSSAQHRLCCQSGAMYEHCVDGDAAVVIVQGSRASRRSDVGNHAALLPAGARLPSLRLARTRELRRPKDGRGQQQHSSAINILSSSIPSTFPHGCSSCWRRGGEWRSTGVLRVIACRGAGAAGSGTAGNGSSISISIRSRSSDRSSHSKHRDTSFSSHWSSDTLRERSVGEQWQRQRQCERVIVVIRNEQREQHRAREH